jgi:uncharacterized RDD family membrane protein YckC
MNQKTTSSLQVVGYASFLQRLYAFLIDCIVFLPFNLWSQHNLFNSKSFTIVVLITATWCIYKPFMDWKFGGSIGKLVLKMRVVDATGKGVSLEQALLRFAPYFAVSLSTLFSTYMLLQSPDFAAITTLEELQNFNDTGTNGLALTITYFLYVTSVSTIFMDPQKQALHDKLANCYCVLVQPLTEEEQKEDHPDLPTTYQPRS